MINSSKRISLHHDFVPCVLTYSTSVPSVSTDCGPRQCGTAVRLQSSVLNSLPHSPFTPSCGSLPLENLLGNNFRCPVIWHAFNMSSHSPVFGTYISVWSALCRVSNTFMLQICHSLLENQIY